MSLANYQTVIGLIVGIFILLIAGIFILLLVTYANKRKRRFIEEKKDLQNAFNEQLLKSQLEIQEQTFDAISHEIHDNVGQVLSLAKLQLNIMNQDDVYDSELLRDARDNVGKAMSDLRDMAKGLNNDRIKSGDIEEIVSQEVARINRMNRMTASMYLRGSSRPLKEENKLIIFRIIQECLQNVIKHSQAENVELSFFYDSELLKVVVADNGIGFQKNLSAKKDCMGLPGISKRAALIGGEVQVDSAPGRGTVITIQSPYA